MDFAAYYNTITGGAATPNTPAATSKKSVSDLSQEDFMSLMLAQMKSQDPFKPTDNTQFIAQMAQLSSVAGISEMKQSMSELAGAMSSSQWLNASGLIGQTVAVASETATIAGGGGVAGYFELAESAPNVSVDIVSSTGAVVQRISLGSQEAGPLHFSWDGTDSDGNAVAAGTYTIKATAVRNGENEALKTYIRAPVLSVSLPSSGTGTQLEVQGLGTVKLSDVKEVG